MKPKIKPRLGFGGPPSEIVYVDFDKSDTGFYRWDRTNNKAVPCEGSCLTGYVVGVRRYDEKEYKGKPVPKLHVVFSAGDRFITVEVGLYTVMSRTILASLSRLRPAHFATPLCLRVWQGEEAALSRLMNAENARTIKGQYIESDEGVDEALAHVQKTLEAFHSEPDSNVGKEDGDERS